MKKSFAYAAAAASVLTAELYRYIFCRNGSPLFNRILDKKGHVSDYYVQRDAAADALRTKEQEHYVITSRRGTKLQGFYFPCGGNHKRIVFIVHGYRSEHAETAGLFYDYYSSRGFDIFACDHTASGESGGHLIGFDTFESQDCLAWIDFLRHKFGDDVQIILHGFSMGGATVLKMSAQCPHNVKFIVSDSGYINAEDIFKARLGPFLKPMSFLNRLISGYSLSDTDVRHELFKSTLPILFVHGMEDRTVPYEQGPAIYSAYGGVKDCLFTENTRHIETIYTAPEKYAEKLDSFIEKFIEK